ncbi:MAG: lipoprotein signal peptidase [Spirochaetota bacterium]
MQFSNKRFLEVIKPSYILAIAIGVFIDLLSKYLVIQNYSAHISQSVLGDFFRMTLTFNTGFVFGIGQDRMIISIFTTGLAIIFLIFYRLQNSEVGHAWGWNLVMVGAFGNFIDKFFVKMPPGGGVRFGLTPTKAGEYIGVVDFLDFDWPDFLIFHRWPAFNFADSCVSVGLVILIITMNREPKA